MREKLTQSDVKKIQQEIEHRKLVERKELIEAVKEARSHGDLSENFEYHAAKKEKNRNESRIRYLERMLKTAVIVEDHSGADEVGLNNTVQVYCEDDDEHKVGDRVFVKVNDEFGYYVVIKKIENTQDEDADKIRSF